jgi:putative ABC transport system permease protein
MRRRLLSLLLRLLTGAGFLQSLRIALGCLAANKLRSMLTMLGVIIGVTSVIVMVSIIGGARDQVVKEFEEMGSRLVIIFFSPEERKKGEGKSHIEFLTNDDADAIRRGCPLVAEVSPEMPMSDTIFQVGGEELKGQLNGCQPEYARLHNVKLQSGRFFSRADYDSWNRVCVIGSEVKEKLWPDRDPIGETLHAQGQSFIVIGVVERKGRSMGQDPDKMVLAPLTTLQKRVSGDKRVWVIWAQTKRVEQTEEAADQIWALLMRRHGNQPDFTVDSQSRILQAVDKILAIFALVFGGVAGLALLVGGIGIMNIMLVSVTERTREIGLRKAVGAKRRHILVQFLTESMTLSGVGGLIGVGCGYGVSRIVDIASKGNMHTQVPLFVSIGAFCFACSVGVFFGIYPAYRASKLDPITALRHE